MHSRYHHLQFGLSVNQSNQLPADKGFEVAFAGRSNAGKSSAINALTHNKKLARISKTPGRTQLLNFFMLDEQHRIVDLPGYGYAKVANSVKQHWQALINSYLINRQSLKGIILMMDIRHPLKPFDQQLLSWCHSCSMPVHILLTKSDKLKRGPANNALLQTRKQLNQYNKLASIQLFSATQHSGLDTLLSVLDEWFEIGQDSNNNCP